MKILIINGPNLNHLGTRENQIYGNLTLEEIKAHTISSVKDIPVTLSWFQSNIEGEIIERLHGALRDFEALIINPAGFSYTSVAILDALKMLTIPKAEVHLSQIYQREEFRTQLLTAKGCDMIMSGLGKETYHIAARALFIKGNKL